MLGSHSVISGTIMTSAIAIAIRIKKNVPKRLVSPIDVPGGAAPFIYNLSIPKCIENLPVEQLIS